MKESFVQGSLNYLIKNNACSKEQINVFRYTLESLYSFFTKTGGIIILSIFLDTFKITTIMLVLYSILRGFSFGIHASKNVYCWITSLSVYGVLPLLIKYINFSNEFLISICILSFVAIIFWSPADTPKRPLLDKKKRIVNKLIALTIAVVYIFVAFILKNDTYFEIVSILLFLNAICICPLTYLIFRVPFNNFKYYKRK